MLSGRSVAPAWIQGLLYLIERKTSILQKTRLLGAFAHTLRHTGAILPLADALYFLCPIVTANVEPAPDHVIGDALLLQFPADAHRTVATPTARANQHLNESVVRQQPLGLKARGHLRGHLRRASLSDQFFFKLTTTVFTSRKPAQRKHPGARKIYLFRGSLQASSAMGSTASPFPAANVLMTFFSRTRFSISAAILGLSLRNWRALSLPWPMRSLPQLNQAPVFSTPPHSAPGAPRS